MGENVRMLISPKIKPGEADKFVDEEEEIRVRKKEWDRMEGRSSVCLAAESTFIFVTRDTSVTRGPNEGDWNRICGESSEERVDTGNQRM